MVLVPAMIGALLFLDWGAEFTRCGPSPASYGEERISIDLVTMRLSFRLQISGFTSFGGFIKMRRSN